MKNIMGGQMIDHFLVDFFPLAAFFFGAAFLAGAFLTTFFGAAFLATFLTAFLATGFLTAIGWKSLCKILFYYYIKSTSNYFEFAPTLNFGFQSNNFESKIRNERNHKSKKGMSVTSPGSTPMIQGNIGVRHGSWHVG